MQISIQYVRCPEVKVLHQFDGMDAIMIPLPRKGEQVNIAADRYVVDRVIHEITAPSALLITVWVTTSQS